jgi:cytochrome c biogenesis protein
MYPRGGRSPDVPWSPEASQLRILKACFAALTSTRLGIIVMVVLTVLSFVGAIIPQGASHEAYVAAYGGFSGDLLWYLGLTDVFRTDYFAALLVFLCIMVFACSLKRLPRRVRLARSREFIADPARVAGMPSNSELTVDVDAEEAALHARDICKRRFYSVSSSETEAARLLFATKMGFSRYGSFLLHLSFIFLLIGGLCITRLGSRYYREIAIGEEFDLPVDGGAHVTVMVEDFNVEIDENDNVSDFICDVALVRDLDIFMRYSIRPNHPLDYGGREIYLQSYAEDMEGLVTTVYDSDGQVVVPHLFLDLDESVYVEELQAAAKLDLGMVPTVRLVYDEGAVETFILGEAFDARADERYQFAVMYAVPTVVVTLEVVKEPFQGFIIGGLALLTLGTFVSLYLSHRRIWFIVSALPGRKAHIVFGGSANRNRDGFAREFDAIRETLDELT